MDREFQPAGFCEIISLPAKEDEGMKIQLAENIRDLRKKRALTQEQLAEALGVTAGAVYKWESGGSLR